MVELKDRPNDPCLSKFAEYLKLSKYILLSKHVDQVCHGRRSKKIMEDAFEALIGQFIKILVVVMVLGQGMDSSSNLFVVSILEKCRLCRISNDRY